MSGIAPIIFGITGSEEKNVLPQAELPLICLELEGQVPWKSHIKSICNIPQCVVQVFYMYL